MRVSLEPGVTASLNKLARFHPKSRNIYITSLYLPRIQSSLWNRSRQIPTGLASAIEKDYVEKQESPFEECAS